jgi:hypothetical protein
VHRAWQADDNSDDVPLCDDNVIIPSMDLESAILDEEGHVSAC